MEIFYLLFTGDNYKILKNGKRIKSMKNVIVTGGSRGIGKAIVKEFALRGDRVLFTYNKSENEAKELCTELGANVRAVKCDVACLKDCENTADMAIKHFGKIDVLINNAGIAQQKLFTDISEDDWDNMFNVNIKGVYRFCKIVLPFMIHEKAGSIINISSIWGMVGASCEVHYSASKAAVIGFTKALAKEVGPSGIMVNAIAPGVIDTDMISAFQKEDRQALIEETPLCTLGTPEDISKTAIYLADSTFITGQVISPNGGFVI